MSTLTAAAKALGPSDVDPAIIAPAFLGPAGGEHVTLNIASYSDDWRSRLLSTFAHTPFELRCGSSVARCASVEGFWQGLKWPEGSAERQRVFGLWGLEAKLAGANAPDGYIDFCGERARRGGPEHHALAERATRAKLEQNRDVQAALFASSPLVLAHDLIEADGRPVPDSLTLPKAVFIETWTRLRSELLIERPSA